MGYQILGGINACFTVYYVMIAVRCLLTFLPNVNWNNTLIKGLVDSVDIYLKLFRKIIPPFGGFDFSPIIAFFVLEYIIRRAVIFILALVLHVLGLL